MVRGNREEEWGKARWGNQEAEGGKARWGNRVAEEVYLRFLKGNQEEAGVGCGVAMIWTLHSRDISGRRASSGCDLLVLPGGGPSGIGMSSSVSTSSSFNMPGGGPSGIGISSSASSTHANQSAEKHTRRNGSPPSSSSGLLVGAAFLEVWPSLGCRRERYTSFRCSGCSSRYFSFFLIMLSSSVFNSLSLF